MYSEKQVFLLKAALIGILGMQDFSYSYKGVNIDVSIWITILVFINHFRFVLLFWLVFEKETYSRNWIIAGVVGSAMYAVSYGVLRGIVSPEPSNGLLIVQQIFLAAIGSFPLWLALRAYYTRAYLWIGATIIGYCFLAVLPSIIDSMLKINFIDRAYISSFLTAQAIPNILWAIAYGLFGLLLGVCFHDAIRSVNENLQTKGSIA